MQRSFTHLDIKWQWHSHTLLCKTGIEVLQRIAAILKYFNSIRHRGTWCRFFASNFLLNFFTHYPGIQVTQNTQWLTLFRLSAIKKTSCSQKSGELESPKMLKCGTSLARAGEEPIDGVFSCSRVARSVSVHVLYHFITALVKFTHDPLNWASFSITVAGAPRCMCSRVSLSSRQPEPTVGISISNGVSLNLSLNRSTDTVALSRLWGYEVATSNFQQQIETGSWTRP